MGEKWFEFVKRIQVEGMVKDKNYTFKQAMMDASKRKSEWKRDGSSVSSSSSTKKKRRGSRKGKKGGKKTKRKH